MNRSHEKNGCLPLETRTSTQEFCRQNPPYFLRRQKDSVGGDYKSQFSGGWAGVWGETAQPRIWGKTGAVHCQRKTGKNFLSAIVREHTGSPLFAIKALHNRTHSSTSDHTEAARLDHLLRTRGLCHSSE